MLVVVVVVILQKFIFFFFYENWLWFRYFNTKMFNYCFRLFVINVVRKFSFRVCYPDAGSMFCVCVCVWMNCELNESHIKLKNFFFMFEFDSFSFLYSFLFSFFSQQFFFTFIFIQPNHHHHHNYCVFIIYDLHYTLASESLLQSEYQQQQFSLFLCLCLWKSCIFIAIFILLETFFLKQKRPRKKW